MKHYGKIFLFLLLLICLTTLASIFKPGFLLSTKVAYVLESDNLNSILLLADIIITIFLFFIQDSETRKSTIMEFQTSTTQLNPGIDNCISVSPWVYQLLQLGNYTSAQPYYFIQVYQEPRAKYALLIPIEATIRTKTDGINVMLSDLEIGYFDNEENIEFLPLPESFPSNFLTVEKIYQSGSKIFICFSFMLDESKSACIQNKIIVISFLEQFTNVAGQRIKRKVHLKIFNSEYGLQFQGQS